MNRYRNLCLNDWTVSNNTAALILMGVDTQIEVVLLDVDDDVHTTAVD